MTGYLALGSNLGDRKTYLISAITLLKARGIYITGVSNIYLTPAIEVTGVQPSYLNMAVSIETGLNPFELLAVCQDIETILGRKRPYPKAPRTIDIDMLIMGHTAISTENLTLPHPRLEQRSFVIYPLFEIAPDIMLPSGRRIRDVRNDFDDAKIEIYSQGRHQDGSRPSVTLADKVS